MSNCIRCGDELGPLGSAEGLCAKCVMQGINAKYDDNPDALAKERLAGDGKQQEAHEDSPAEAMNFVHRYEPLGDSEFYRWLGTYDEPYPSPKTMAKAAWFASQQAMAEKAAQHMPQFSDEEIGYRCFCGASGESWQDHIRSLAGAEPDDSPSHSPAPVLEDDSTKEIT